MPPTLYIKGSLRSLNDKIQKQELDNYVPMHYIINICMYKLAKKEKVNRHDRLFLLKSETGSGKTTAFILDLFRTMFTRSLALFNQQDADAKQAFRRMLPSDFSVFDFPDDEYTLKNRSEETIKPVYKKFHYIACTQPKSVTARGKAEENSSEKFNPDIKLGDNIGYSTGNYKYGFSSKEGIIYLTLGSMFQYLKTHTDVEIMERYDIICIDECHERSVDLDFTLCLLLEFMNRNTGNPDMPLIIFMSATFEIEKFARYMETSSNNAAFVVGETSNKEIIWLDAPTENYHEEAAKMVMKVHSENESDPSDQRDILIFINGDADAKKIKREIELIDIAKEILITTVTRASYNANPTELMNLINNFTIMEAASYAKKPSATRRVSIATNIIETGLTINSLKYVIDTGYEKSSAYSPIHDVRKLLDRPITQSSAMQRYGRVGRKFPGIVLPLYTKQDFDALEQYSLPQIYSCNITKNILEIMFATIPAEQVFMPLLQQQFEKFVQKCLVDCVDIGDDSNNCNNIFIGQRNLCEENFNFIAAKSQIDEPVKVQNYPHHLLDNIPQDTFIISRNKLIGLGFFGTYLGYIASKISRFSAENIRMVMAGNAYGCSINDLLTIGSIAAATECKYIVSPTESFLTGKPKFSIFNLLRELLDKDIVKKYYFGDVSNFIYLFHDDFIRGLMIVRWVVAKARKGLRSIERECLNMGIKWSELMLALDDRMSAAKDFNKFGFVNLYPELNFNCENIIDEVCRIKKCIYAGYKFNIAYLQENNMYKTPTGIEFSYLGYVLKRPKKIIYSHLFMKNKPGSIYYEVTTNCICSLDGII
jgi:Helicase conserved C-terminal domain